MARARALLVLLLQATHSLLHARDHRRLPRVRLGAGDMGFQPQAEPLIGTGVVAVAFGYLRLRIGAYNAEADALEALLEDERQLRVRALDEAVPAATVEAARRAVAAARRRVERARTVRAFGLEGRLRVPARGFDDDDRGAAAAREAARPAPTVVTAATAPWIVAAVLATTVPVFLLLATDPLAAGP